MACQVNSYFPPRKMLYSPTDQGMTCLPFSLVIIQKQIHEYSCILHMLRPMAIKRQLSGLSTVMLSSLPSASLTHSASQSFGLALQVEKTIGTFLLMKSASILVPRSHWPYHSSTLPRALLQASFYWNQATAVQQNIPEFDAWGWYQDSTSKTWEPSWTNLGDTSKACTILLHCGCKKACRGHCKCCKAGVRCTSICACEGACTNNDGGEDEWSSECEW